VRRPNSTVLMRLGLVGVACAGIAAVAPVSQQKRNASSPRRNTTSANSVASMSAGSAIRALRPEVNVPAAARVPLLVKDAEPDAAARLTRHREHFVGLARLANIAAAEAVPAGSVPVVVPGATLIESPRCAFATARPMVLHGCLCVHAAVS